MQRVVFTVWSPLGYRVRLTRNRWREILGYKHPSLAGSEQTVRRCVEHPMVVQESVKDPHVHLHYARAGHVHLCVVVAPADGEERFVVTAYFTKNIKKGKELWRS